MLAHSPGSLQQRSEALGGGASCQQCQSPALAAECEAWKQSRATFIDKLQQRDEETMKQAWQRFYFKGETATGDSGATDHSSRMRLAVPTDRRTRHTGSK